MWNFLVYGLKGLWFVNNSKGFSRSTIHIGSRITGNKSNFNPNEEYSLQTYCRQRVGIEFTFKTVFKKSINNQTLCNL